MNPDRGSVPGTLLFCLVACGVLLGGHAFADATVTATGYAFCYDGTTQRHEPLEGARVELMDSDCDGSQICDDEMGRSYVRADGSFRVTGSGGDPGLFGTDPDLYLRFVYNDDQGVRLTNEFDSTRSWSTPEHDHDNFGGGTIDFGAWSTGNGVGPGEGTQCGVWRQARRAFQGYKNEIGAEPPAGHLDVEYWSAVWAGTPWTNTDTVHWPIHYPSDALQHEFGHSIRHAADGDGDHFSWDVTRFQYARTHSACAADGNRNPSESDESLAGYAFNEGWAEYWDGETYGCAKSSEDDGRREGMVARALFLLQKDQGLTRKHMVSVLIAGRGSIHNLSEFTAALSKQMDVRMGMSALTQDTTRAVVDHRPYTETQRVTLLRSQIEGINRQIAVLRSQIERPGSPTKPMTKDRPSDPRAVVSPTLLPCHGDDCSALFRRLMTPALIQAEVEGLEAHRNVLERATSDQWPLLVRHELEAKTFDSWRQKYSAGLKAQMRRAFLEALTRAEVNLREAGTRLQPAAYDAFAAEIAEARSRLDPTSVDPGGVAHDGWLPQLSLPEDMAGRPVLRKEAGLSVPANVTWVDSGVAVTTGQHLVITAAGTWSNSGPPAKGPRGFENYKYAGTILATADLASLIGKIGDTMFSVGDRFDGTSPASGELYFSINDAPGTFADNQGSLSVDVRVE